MPRDAVGGNVSITLESFYDLTEPTTVAVSPDGDRVAVAVRESDPAADERTESILVVPTDGSEPPHRLTRASQAGDPTWSPDGRYLAFVAAREPDLATTVGRASDDGDGTDDDTDPKPQVWAFDLARGGDAIQLTAFAEGVREFDWGPDGDSVVVSARDPTDDEAAALSERRDGGPIQIDRLQHKADGVGWLDDVTTYLFVAAVDGDPADADTARRLDEAYGAGAREPLFGLQPAWGANDRIAFGSNRTEHPDDSGAIELYTIDPDGTDCRRCTDGSLRTGAYTWSPTGERLAFAVGDPQNWYDPTELHVTDLAGDGLVDHHAVTGSLDRTLARDAAPVWTDDELLVPIADEGLTRLVRASADRDDPVRTLDAQTRDRTLAGFDANGGHAAAIFSDQSAGDDVFTVPTDALDDGSTTRVTALNDELLAGELPTCRRVSYENGDGETIEAIVHLPSDFEPDDERPVVACVHGGPMSYDAPEFRFTYTYWATRGYVVYRPNYRGSTSYGRLHAESLKGTRGELESDDVVSGLRALADRGWVDPDRSLVTGFSYGGITTANVVTRSDAFAVAAAEHGVYDFRSTFGTDDNHLWHEWEFGLPWEEPDTYEEISSIDDVDAVETPILLTAGEEDWRCPPTQAEQFYVSVSKRGVPARLVVYRNEHHNVGDPDRAIHRVETITDWFAEHADVPGTERDE